MADVNEDTGKKCLHPFQTPLSLLVCGSSFSGKSTLVAEILLNKAEMFTDEIKEILYVYNVWQPLFDRMETQIPNIKFVNSIPSKEEIENFTSNKDHKLMVLDDQMLYLSSNKDITEYVTVHCHHRNLSTIIILQNIYHKAPCLRDISLNVQGIILFKNLRCYQQVRQLANQMFPGKHKYFLDAFDKACNQRPFGYIVIDLNPRSSLKFQLYTDCLPGQELIAFLPK